MFSALKADINAILSRDPAAGGWLSAIFLYPSFHVMLFYRIAHPLWRIGFKFLPRLMMQTARWLTGIEIHPGAQIGIGFFTDHGMGVVIGQTAIIGKNVTLYQDVVLGGIMPAVDAKSQRTIKRHPTLEDNVIVGAGAQILGPVTIGKSARVGGNSVVTKDVKEGQTVVGIPAKSLSTRRQDRPFEAYAVTDISGEDTQSRAIVALSAEIEVLRMKIEHLNQENLNKITKSRPSPSPKTKV